MAGPSPHNPGTGVEDIFEDTEQGVPSPAPPASPRPAAASRQQPPSLPPTAPRPPFPSGRKLRILFLTLGVIGVLGLGGAVTWQWINDRAPEPLSTETPDVQENPAVPEGNLLTNIVVPEADDPHDADRDGLKDEEEVALGTDQENSDSDNDGLPDYDEVRVYQTDPLDPDTDGDGFTDGEEVAARFNPNGPGTLLDLENAIEGL